MYHLPDELLCSIFKYSIDDVHQLLQLQLVCKKFQGLSNNAYLWYFACKKMYPKWIDGIHYAHDKQPSIDWKQFMLRLYKQKTFMSTKFKLESILSKKKDRIPPSTYAIDEPIVADIDPVTNAGIVAVSKSGCPTRHKVLFYAYPSYTLLRKLELKFTLEEDISWTCQMVGMQTLHINNEKVRLFAISINEPREDDDDEQAQTCWCRIVIYRLYDDGKTTCLANVRSYMLGRGAWFFHTMNDQQKQWLQIISPDRDYDVRSRAFLMVFGIGEQCEGIVQVFSFDTEENNRWADPSQVQYEWNDQDFIISNPLIHYNEENASAFRVTVLKLEARVSCMVHFSHIQELNHLICTGNFHGEDLSIYDWRFGIKVGYLPYVKRRQAVQPWGLESTFAIPPPPSGSFVSAHYGPRLIVVSDDEEKFEIKVWDLSPLLKVHWNPFDQALTDPHVDIPNLKRMHSAWWDRKTKTLNQLALDLYNGDVDKLPYTISTASMKIMHLLDAQVKYVAYNGCNTWLYLLRGDGVLSVTDIESGQVLATVDTGGVADDVNTIGNNEIVVSRKLELKRCVLPL